MILCLLAIVSGSAATAQDGAACTVSLDADGRPSVPLSTIARDRAANTEEASRATTEDTLLPAPGGGEMVIVQPERMHHASVSRSGERGLELECRTRGE